MLSNKKNLVLVDASHLFHRSWNVFKTLKTKTGLHTGVPFGVIRTLIAIKKKFQDSSIIFALDGSPRLRRELSPTYKASRTPNDDVYESKAMALTKEMLLAAGCVISHDPDFECDDIIAMLTESPGYEKIYIYSGDDDFCQLATESIIIWKPGISSSLDKTKQKDRFLLPLEVFSEWGVVPRSLALYRSFVGDSSDEIKGLPRIPRGPLQAAIAGKSTPAEFYEPIISGRDAFLYFTQEWRERLAVFRPQCELNYRITKLPFSRLEYIPCEFTDVQSDVLKNVFVTLEFNSMLKKFDEVVSLLSPKTELTV